ncbi:helix-turn-helix domain-containing protein [Prosthecomicrobium hirschii]|uniref:helix-turn-helix domain-containing protein n=1 Tax=Prosthecodimorpha hirschii TaxID=665126 RepID=UPI0022200A54|nr:helix-turn-helix transcriptional regulator [Prosthecomicrobium hirschii]MCW1839425.1 helix-turn-helix transcriptional regulator [Prosthecomicrobium hirschii]
MSTNDATSPDAPAWQGLKLPIRRRFAEAVAHFHATGRLNRSDIMRLGDVSIAQASIDLKEISARLPGLMVLDPRAKGYVRPDAVLPPREPPTKAEPAELPPMPPQEHAVVAFRRARISLGLTQAQWGDWLGLGRRQVIAYEAGDAPIPLGTARLAEAYASGWRPAAWSEPADADAEAERAS